MIWRFSGFDSKGERIYGVWLKPFKLNTTNKEVKNK